MTLWCIARRVSPAGNVRFNTATRRCRPLIFLAALLSGAIASAQTEAIPPQEPSGPDNPVVARYNGGQVTLHGLEEYVREMPLGQRIPFAKSAGEWRNYMSGELAKMTALTSQAKSLGYHMDPGYLRAREYFINEYLCYAVLRDNVQNKVDVSVAAQTAEYNTNKSDFWASATVTLRMIRSRDKDRITSAAKELASGADFRTVEMEASQVSPRYRGTVIGPFPSAEKKTGIPPPDEVLRLAMAQPEGATTGPVEILGFYYIVKTEKKTPGRQRRQDELGTELEDRLRGEASKHLVPKFVDRVVNDLGVAVDEALFEAGTNPQDVLATVGVTRITRKEYTDLNGRVRGPASPLASMMPTPLKGFVLPYMLADWGRANGYLDHPETKRAIYYYDLQHLASAVEMEMGMKLLPLPSDAELREQFQEHISDFRQGEGAPEPKFEDHRQEMLDIVRQARAPEAERAVRQVVLQKLEFQHISHPVVRNITPYEAVVKAQDKLTSGVNLVDITPTKVPTQGAGGSTPYYDYGRAPEWRIRVKTADGKSSEILVSGPAKLLDSEKDYAGIPAVQPWTKLWRFDTDSLKRHAIDKAVGDFAALYGNRVKVAARVNFDYSPDAPTSPTVSTIVYSVVPVDEASTDSLSVTYNGESGDVLKRVYGSEQNRCLTCDDARPEGARHDKKTVATTATMAAAGVTSGIKQNANDLGEKQ